MGVGQQRTAGGRQPDMRGNQPCRRRMPGDETFERAFAGGGRFAELLTDPLGPDLFALDRGRFVRMMLDRNQVFLGSTLIRRTALDRLGEFDPGLFGGEDYELCLRLAAGARWAFLNRPLARYEKHPGGLSADPDRMAREFALAMRDMAARPDLFTPAEYAVVRRRHRELSTTVEPARRSPPGAPRPAASSRAW